MGQAIGEILPAAVGVAISVGPIIAVIVMLFTERARSNSIAFLAGWVLGLAVVGAAVLAIGGSTEDEGASTGAGVAKLVLGLLLLLLAGRNWRSRPKDGEEPEMPKWMASVDAFSAPKSLGLAFVLAAVNPKNLALTAAAALSISAAGLATGEQIVVLAVFIALASATIALPVVGCLILGKTADAPLTAAKAWLVANNNAVMAVLLLVFGVKLLGDGIAILA